MSRKRSLKKQQKRQASALAELEELYRRGADEELVARAAEEVPDLFSSPFGAKWAEAADRALRQSLARADFGRLEGLLRSLRRTGPPRPLAALAEAVLDIAAGRLAAARSRLAALSCAPDAGAVPRDVLTALAALARDEPDGCSSGDDPYLQAARELFGALQAPAIDPKAVARSLQALRATVPAQDGEARRRLDGAERCLALLEDLASLEARLTTAPLAGLPEDGAPLASRAVIAWLRSHEAALSASVAPALGSSPLLAPLHDAARLRWRAVLERVAAREGPSGLASLVAADPKLLTADVALPTGTGQGALTDLRQYAQAQQLLAGRRYGDLADLLRTRSRTAAGSGDLAAFWSLELWARGRPAPSAADEDEDDEDDFFADLSEPLPHRTLLRLGEMAGEIGRRFPAEHRAEVAQVLRDRLFDLCEDTHFCEHTAAAALALLEYLPSGVGGVGPAGDTGLLIAAVAGAVSGGDRRALRAVQARLTGGGKAQAGDRAVAERLMALVAQEEPGDIAQILTVLRPLFTGGGWPEVTALVAREMAGTFVRSLKEASFLAQEDRLGGTLVRARRVLDDLRPSLGGTAGLTAMELALDGWRSDLPAVEKRVQELLAACPGFEDPLTFLRVLEEALSPSAPQGIQQALNSLAEAVVDRLDNRWQLWWHDVPILALMAGKSHRRRLEKRVRQLLASAEIQGDDRKTLERVLEVIRRIETMRRETGGRSKARRERRAGPPQLPLDFP